MLLPLERRVTRTVQWKIPWKLRGTDAENKSSAQMKWKYALWLVTLFTMDFIARAIKKSRYTSTTIFRSAFGLRRRFADGSAHVRHETWVRAVGKKVFSIRTGFFENKSTFSLLLTVLTNILRTECLHLMNHVKSIFRKKSQWIKHVSNQYRNALTTGAWSFVVKSLLYPSKTKESQCHYEVMPELSIVQLNTSNVRVSFPKTEFSLPINSIAIDLNMTQ